MDTHNGDALLGSVVLVVFVSVEKSIGIIGVGIVLPQLMDSWTQGYHNGCLCRPVMSVGVAVLWTDFYFEQQHGVYKSGHACGHVDGVHRLQGLPSMVKKCAR